jgi:hypothetical protein
VKRAAVLACALALAAGGCKKGSKSGSGASGTVKDLVSRTFAFEGEIENESRFLTGTSMRSTFKMKGQRVRVSMPSGALIADMGAKKSYLLDDVAKTYSTMDWGTLSVDASAPARTRTGKKDVVAGYGCEVYESTTPGGDRLQACVTTEIYGAMAHAAGALGVFGDELGFPLRTILQNPSGKEVYRSEVIRIDKRPIPESDVTVPPGYKEL